jgi:hypothetical protein
VGTPPGKTGGVYRFWSWILLSASNDLGSDAKMANGFKSARKIRSRDNVAGVPAIAVCEASAAEALHAAEETKLSSVRDLYRRSTLRWSELADQKITRAGS